jgi:hypothetical protein
MQIVIDPVSTALLSVIAAMMYWFGRRIIDHEIRIALLELEHDS